MYSITENFKDLRHHIQLLHALMLNHREAVKAMGDESLVAVTDLVAGEKDPRNLMIVFSVLKVIMMEWKISDYAEVFISVLKCVETG